MRVLVRSLLIWAHLSHLNRKSKLKTSPRFRRGKFNTGYSEMRYYLTFDIEINKIRIFIKDVGLIGIEESPHYKHLLSKYMYKEENFEYANYLIQNHENEDLVKSLSKFDQTLSYVSNNPNKQVLLARYKFRNENHVILLDGLHRLACLKYLGVNSVRCAIL